MKEILQAELLHRLQYFDLFWYEYFKMYYDAFLPLIPLHIPYSSPNAHKDNVCVREL